VPRLPPHTGLIGGIDGRNWSPVVSRNGVIEPHLVKTGAGKLGRGALGACGKGGGVAAEPSAARSPMSNWATVAPTRIPSRLRWLLGIALSSVTSNWSRLLFAAG